MEPAPMPTISAIFSQRALATMSPFEWNLSYQNLRALCVLSTQYLSKSPKWPRKHMELCIDGERRSKSISFIWNYFLF
jgi:hypothetical protein